MFCLFPRPLCWGLIEAGAGGCAVNRRRIHFPGHCAGASLKRRLVADERPGGRRFPRPLCWGLIEARYGGPGQPHGWGVFPRPLCWGLIEACWSPQRCAAACSFPRPLCWGLIEATMTVQSTLLYDHISPAIVLGPH